MSLFFFVFFYYINTYFLRVVRCSLLPQAYQSLPLPSFCQLKFFFFFWFILKEEKKRASFFFLCEVKVIVFAELPFHRPGGGRRKKKKGTRPVGKKKVLRSRFLFFFLSITSFSPPRRVFISLRCACRTARWDARPVPSSPAPHAIRPSHGSPKQNPCWC